MRGMADWEPAMGFLEPTRGQMSATKPNGITQSVTTGSRHLGVMSSSLLAIRWGMSHRAGHGRRC